MSPELEDVLRALVKQLENQKVFYPDKATKNALQAVSIAIVQTIYELRDHPRYR